MGWSAYVCSMYICVYVYICMYECAFWGRWHFREVNGLLLKSQHIGDDSLLSVAIVFQVCPI